MPSQDYSSEYAARAYSLFLPVFLLAFAVVILVGFQAGQSIRERRQLLNVRTSQQQPMTESRNVRTQLETTLKGIDELAEAGNQNAINVQARLGELGLQTPGVAAEP